MQKSNFFKLFCFYIFANSNVIHFQRSQTWECELCGKLCDHLAKENEGGHRLGSAKPLTQEESELIQQIALKVCTM